jgi:mannosyltransferase
MTTATSRRPLAQLLDIPPIAEVHPPRWFARLPGWLSTGGILVFLLLVSAIIRTRTLSGELWFAEADAIGIAHHSIAQLPGVLRAEGASPLYYLLLHVWISLFGMTEATTHGLSLLIGLVTIPMAMWVGWSTGGRRAGIFAALLFALSSFLTRYAEETQPYELMVALGLLTTAAFIHGFVRGRRRWLWVFGAGLTAMLYTQATALLLWAATAGALLLVVWVADPERRARIVRDGLLCFGGALALYLPWLPSTIAEIAHDTAPFHYLPLPGATVPSQLLGSERVDVTLLVAALVGVAEMAAPARRRSPEAVTLWSLLIIPATGLVVARVVGLIGPFWAWRYLAPIVPGLLLFCALSSARAKVVGVAAMVFCVAFLANPASFAPSYKSDMQDVAAEMTPRLHVGDVVVVAQPEQAPLAWYYLPRGLRFANLIGPVRDPSSLNWSGAMTRLQRNDPLTTARDVIATLKPGQQLLYVRPLTEGVKDWSEPWTLFVRRRAAQWGQILAGDVAAGTLKAVAWAPHNYRSACCIASAATLYQRAS